MLVLARAPKIAGLLNGLGATWGTLSVAVLVAVLIGVLGGLPPSYQAASTEIVRGLRHIG